MLAITIVLCGLDFILFLYLLAVCSDETFFNN